MKTTPIQAKAVLRSNEHSDRILKKAPFKRSPRRNPQRQDIKKEAPHLELFQKEGCPYSHAVRNYLSTLGIDFIARNVAEHQDLKHHQLVLAGGKNQIPFLMDHRSGVKLYECDAIIAYLKKEYGKPVSGRAMRMLEALELRMRAQAERFQWAMKTPIERLQTFNHQARDLFGNTTDILKATFREIKEAVSSETDRTSAHSERTETAPRMSA